MHRRSALKAWLVAAIVACATAPLAHTDERASTSGNASGPGPPLWRVSRGEHELWLFGTLSSVPEDLRWRSAAVEHAIAASQEVLLPPGARAAITLKPVELVRAWRRVRELSRNPDGKHLVEVLPPELHGRYLALRERYLGRSRSIETQRPIIAAARLYQAALDELGLSSGRSVQSSIERLARRAGVAVTDARLHVDPDALLDEAARVPSPAELDCVAKVLSTIERAEEQIAARAHAWVHGDVEALRQFEYPDIRKQCVAFPGWPEGLRRTLAAADDKWFAEAERALSTNRRTFGTVDLRELIAPDGLLARFRKRGYEIRPPDDRGLATIGAR